ncbi:MAG: tRNA 2-selenouridine(34) synthase MnmH [Bacteroidetes bacterium]|nr:tRNA 2-selenouridine(34) synthase MnmH [Bacteroidota bacterium]MBS1740649.1 tRNA 2-selenouridine(34) synthase MnmH [Bacteroidota bacterium]
MSIERIHIDQFIELSFVHPVFDVRSPGEFFHAHLPKAFSLPLFTDEQRQKIGTAYKQIHRKEAIKIGVDYFGPRMRTLIEEVETILKNNNPHTDNNTLLIHCWRGGMRSGAVAWLMDLYGFKVYLLEGGYKAFRNWVLQQFAHRYNFKIIGGYTGSGKTELLTELEKNNEKIINLEALACHKGSAFGALGNPPQPSNEMFENRLAMQLFSKTKGNANQFIWIEDESQRIGNLNIPKTLWEQMRNQTLFFLNIPFEKRLDYICTHYGKFPKDMLINAIVRIQKRLGGLETKNAIHFLLENDVHKCFEVLLRYYDKQYEKGLHKRTELASILQNVPCESVSAPNNVKKLLENVRN